VVKRPRPAKDGQSSRTGGTKRSLENEEFYTPGDRQRGAGDIRREVRAEKRHGVGDLLRLAGAAERRSPDHPLVQLGIAHVERLRADDAGDDRVAGDAVPTAFEGKGPRQPEDALLRGRVGRLAE